MDNPHLDAQPYLSERYRSGGAVIGISIILDEGEDFQWHIDQAYGLLRGAGFTVKELDRGERPAFGWELAP